MSRSPVSLKIDDAIRLLERHGQPVTPDAIRVNVRKQLTWSDFSTEQALEAVIDRYLSDRLKANGHVIADRVTRERKRFWSCEIEDLEEQLAIKEESQLFDVNRIRADRAVIDFLKEKRKELAYEPYPGLFQEEVGRIYAMYSIPAPGNEVEVVAS